MKRFTLRPVSGDLFVGRRKLLSEMLEELSNTKSSEGFCIYGRRRVGKTSLMKELGRRLKRQDDIVVVYFSLWEISSLTLRTLVEELSEAIIRAYQEKGLLRLELSLRRGLGGARDVTARTVSGAEVERVEFFLNLGERRIEDYAPLVKEVFELAEELAEKTGTKCVLMLDEFPEVIRLENGLQVVRNLRTAYERLRRVALIISGSVRKTIDQVALSDASPFYGQLVCKKLPPLCLGEVEEFLLKYAGIKDRELAAKMLSITGGVPFYLQYLGRVSDLSNPEVALEEFLEEEGSIIFQEEFRRLGEVEKRIVVAIAQGNERLTDIARITGLGANTVATYLRILAGKEIVERLGRGKYSLVDTMFLRWLASTSS